MGLLHVCLFVVTSWFVTCVDRATRSRHRAVRFYRWHAYSQTYWTLLKRKWTRNGNLEKESKSRVFKRALSEQTVPTSILPLSWEKGIIITRHAIYENDFRFPATWFLIRFTKSHLLKNSFLGPAINGVQIGLNGKLWVAHFERGLLFPSQRKVIAEAGNKWRRK